MTEHQGTLWQPALTPAVLSHLARLNFAPYAPATKLIILAAIAAGMEEGDHGRTCDEIEVEHGLLHQTASACITEMHAGPSPSLCASGYTRPTRSGNEATVWRIILAASKEPEHSSIPARNPAT